jgi:hypothetical protein
MNKVASISLSADALVIIILAIFFLIFAILFIGNIFGEYFCIMKYCPFN